MNRHFYGNTGKLSSFLLKQDRIRIPVWLLSITGITIVIANTFSNLYPTEEERQAIAETMYNPAMSAMFGRGYGLENYTYGAMMAHQMLLFTALAVAIMSILLVARHTRTEEEDGRMELVRSLPTGRLSNMSATVFILFVTNFVLACLVGFGLYTLQIESMDMEGSLLYGAALGATGFFFTAVTAVLAQLSDNSRGTIGLALVVLGISYVIRAIGDAGNEAVSWFSPLGWVLGAEVYVQNYWWPILLTVIVSILLIFIAFYLNSIRDLAAGFLPSRAGKAHASIFLQSPLGHALRLQRTGLIAWSIGMYLLGASYGSVFGDLESFFAELEMIEQMLDPVEGYSLTEQFVGLLMIIMAMISTVPPLMAILRLKGEEKKNRLELIYSGAVSRSTIMVSYLVIAIASSFIMVSLTAIGLWSASVAVMDDPIALGTIYNASIVYLPAIWVIIGVALLFLGIRPKLTGLSWLYLGYSFFVVYLGSLLDFPEWMEDLSPFGHIPELPVEDMNWVPISVLTVIAIVLIGLGFIGYNHRDIEG